VRRLALALAAVALAGCESSQEESAKLKAQAKHVALASNGLQITRASTQVAVLSAVTVTALEGAAVAVTLRNRTPRALHGVPIAVTVADASGHTLYQNNAAGLEAALTSVPSLAPHQTLTWIDDQVTAGGGAAHASARVGEAASSGGKLPAASISGVQQTEDPSNGDGVRATLSNRSASALHALVVYAIARRAGRVVAAGRAVVPEVAAGASAPVQVYFIGEAKGASVELQPDPAA
jgi:hypothetical protein